MASTIHSPVFQLLVCKLVFPSPLSANPSSPAGSHFHSNKMKGAIMNQEKLAKLQAQVHCVGKGTTHPKKLVHRLATADDKKLQFFLKKSEYIPKPRNRIHFHNPKVWAIPGRKAFTIPGHAETEQLINTTQCLQPTWRSLASLRRLAEALPKQSMDCLEKHHLLPERRRRRMKFQTLWRILMKLLRMEQTELSQLLKKIKLEEVTGSCYFISWNAEAEKDQGKQQTNPFIFLEKERSSEAEIILKDKIYHQPAPDIRKKLQKLTVGPEGTFEEPLQAANRVFYTWDQEEIIHPRGCISAIAHQQNGMIRELKGIERVSQARVVIDPCAVVEEVIIDLKSNSHGPMMDQLELHQGLIAAPIETSHIVVLGGVITEAVLLRFARRISACVGEAGLFHQPKILGIFSCDESLVVHISKWRLLLSKEMFRRAAALEEFVK
ncbi:hypothetical protein GH733_007282, partial [Mirounga leonina]